MQKLLFRLIGVLEIAGGLFGLVAMIERLLHGGAVPDVVVAVLGAVLFALLLVAGVLLLEGGESGVRLSRWMQLAQLPVLGMPFFSYGLHAGARLDLVVLVRRPLALALNADIGSWHWMLALGGPHTWHLGVNLAALAAWLVLRMRR